LKDQVLFVCYDKKRLSVIRPFVDVTERLLMQEELQRSKEIFRITMETIGDGVIVTDTASTIMRLNPVAAKLTGWSEEEAIGVDLEEVFNIRNKSTNASVVNSVNEVIEFGRIVTLPRSTILISRNQQVFDISDSAAPIRSEEGGIVGVVIVFRDITDELKTQQQLQQSQKLDAVGKLASGIVHDFNNMLGGIIVSAELLQRRLSGDQVGEKYLNILLESANRAAELANKLLALTSKQSVRPTLIDVHQVLSHTLSLLENTVDRKIRIEADFSAGASMIVGDNSQLVSILKR
jgi:two-component system cell cycle sensor histidine kinase/response regulator CckA